MIAEVGTVRATEPQYGFRKGHGCTDMVFTIRQFTKKAIEHQA